MASYADHLQVAVAAAKSAGQIILDAFKQPKQVQHKGAVDLVTETDKKCESVIFSQIRAVYGDSHCFIGEEASSEQGTVASLTDAPTWMVDPVDGTTNFVHTFPFVCVSIALVINREPVVGVVFNPVLNELFTATKGGGAFLNGERIHCSKETQLGNALLGTEIGTDRDPAIVIAVFQRIRTLTAAMRSVRCGGSCALGLCGVACGRLDAFYEIGFGGCWDVAAGAVIVCEAGGQVLDPSGGAFDVMGCRVLAANAHLGKPVSLLLQQAETQA
jgi:inositol-phosphate phosphatase / L-galactose 1-phosphate phosphatase